MSGRRSRNKGARGEREVIAVLEAAGLGTFRRCRQAEHGARTEVPDVDGDGDWPYWCEVKRQKRPNIRAAVAQASEDCHDGRVPVAITKADREPWLVTMPLSAWVQLVEKAS